MNMTRRHLLILLPAAAVAWKSILAGCFEELAKACDAEVAASIGKVAILYRARDEEPEIELP